MQRIEFSSPLANAQNYPAAILKVEPQQPFFSLTFFANKQLKKLGLAFFRSGRGALYFAAEQLKKPGDNVILLPAYHCPALVEPFIAAGYQLTFYPLQADLTVDLEQLKNLMTPKTTHCLLVRYFGNEAQVGAQLAWLSAQGLITFDDCAHDLQSFIRPEMVADAAICSVKKFIAGSDGGALRLKQNKVTTLKPLPVQAEIKNLLKTILSGLLQIRAAQAVLLPMPLAPNSAIAKPAAVVANNKAAHSAPLLFRYLQSKDKEERCYRFTEWLFYHTDLQKVFNLRQQNCKQLIAGLADSTLGRLLWVDMAASCAPYVLPFLLNNSSSFDLLRKRGLQIYRWEELAPTSCIISQDYRHRLIQIPCHQDLNETDILQIIQAFR